MPLLLLQLADQHLCVTLANLFYQININFTTGRTQLYRVEPLLNDHPQGISKWLPNGGWAEGCHKLA